VRANKLNENVMRISLAVALLCLSAVGARMRGQEKADMAVHVKVVNVPATVRDKHGKIVNNLTKDDFELEEDGRPQTLHYFSQESRSASNSRIAGRYEHEPAASFGPGTHGQFKLYRSDAASGQGQSIPHSF
jgi:hypothetical protein